MRPMTAVRAFGAVGTVLALGAGALVATKAAPPGPPDRPAARVVSWARQEIGTVYQYGAAGPARYDCSGFVQRLWRAAGASGVPRVSRDQQRWAWPMRAADARPGDLVFFGEPVNHVGIYVGNGKMIDASRSRGRVVERAVWTSDVVRYGRVRRSGIAAPPPPSAPKAKPAPAKPAAAKPAAPAAASSGAMRPVPGPNHRSTRATSAWAAKVVAAARHQRSARWGAGMAGPRFDAAGLVRHAVWRADGRALPRNARELERRTRPVALRDLQVGDLVFYGSPAVHVGIYVGRGMMIDASKVFQRVLERRVFASETVRFARLR